MKSDYKTIEWVKVNQEIDMTSLEKISHWGNDPIDPMISILSDLEELKLTTEVLRCESPQQLYETLKNTRYISINNSLESTEPIIITIKNFIERAHQTMFRDILISELNKIPQEYALRAKTAELVFKLL